MFLKSAKNSFNYLIVGLGNPGIQYEKTRHNVGFNAMLALCDRLGLSLNKIKFNAKIADGKIGNQRCLFMMPQTYMNNSGEAVAAAAKFYKIPPENILVLLDDVSLPVGRMRLRAKGSAGGHNGLKSIIECTGSDAFMRVKIGVGEKPHPDYDLADWVLGKFSPEDCKVMEQQIKNAADAAVCVVEKGIDAAMARYNN